MIKVLFFAQIRETIGTKELVLSHADLTVARLIEELSSRGEKWSMALREKTILCAVNQRIVEFNCIIKEGDEVAFFPPVTGG